MSSASANLGQRMAATCVGGPPHHRLLITRMGDDHGEVLKTRVNKISLTTSLTCSSVWRNKDKHLDEKLITSAPCARFLYSGPYVKNHILERSHSFRMTAAGRPLQPHPAFLLPPSTHPKSPPYLSVLSARISSHMLHRSRWVKARVTQITGVFKGSSANCSCVVICTELHTEY